MRARLFCVLAVACGFFISADKPSGIEPVSYRQAATLSLAERRAPNQKAERGDAKAAFALAPYYPAVSPNAKNCKYFLILASKKRFSGNLKPERVVHAKRHAHLAKI